MNDSLAPLPALPDLSHGLRLVAVDMDGTLLDEHGRIPDRLWPLLERLHDAGVAFAPASGRQYATLARQFGGPAGAPDGMVFIAENGTYVVRDGIEVSSAPLAPAMVSALVREVRTVEGTRDLGTVVCGKRSAYIERSDIAFVDLVGEYYAALEVVPDLTEVTERDEVIKVAVRDASTSVPVAEALAPVAGNHQVVVSGQHWMDVMAPGASKGSALARLQAAWGITREQTVVFGDYLNDLEMLDEAAGSFAMANAHPEVRARASYLAPPNTEHGVITTLERLLDRLPVAA